MIRVRVVCEGQTEVKFINDVLRDSFSRQNIHLFASLLGKPGHKGGNVKFARLLMDVGAQLRQDKIAYCTTFFDFYGLLAEFPGKREAQAKTTSKEKAECVLQAMTTALRKELGDNALRRFVPYIQMHEFEGLLFSAPAALAKVINKHQLRQELEKIRMRLIPQKTLTMVLKQRQASELAHCLRSMTSHCMDRWLQKKSDWITSEYNVHYLLAG